MTELIFYEKPGCVGNRRQRSRLQAMGLQFEVRDLLSEPWSAADLRPFFNETPVGQWFNQSSPRVKAGEIDVDRLDETQALELMLADPLLICRPLLRYGRLMQSGFVAGPVLDALGVVLEQGRDLQSCPMSASENPCGIDADEGVK